MKKLNNLIDALRKAAQLGGFDASTIDFEIKILKAGPTHVRPNLPKDKKAIYCFFDNEKCLKVGRTDRNERYKYHHYRENGNRSTLAKSLATDKKYNKKIKGNKIEEWICDNISRYNILMPKSTPFQFFQFAESFFILQFKPIFESRKNKNDNGNYISYL